MSDINIKNYKLPNKVVKKMRYRIDDTQQTGLENGFLLCVPKGSDVIKDSSHSMGKAGSIRHFSNQCPKGEKYVGNYHTHPNEEDIMSPEDFLSTCKDKVSCIGGSSGNITCFTRKVHPIKSRDRNIRKECEKDIKSIIETPVVTWASYQKMDELSDKYFEKTKISKDYKLDDGNVEEFELVEVQD